ncbi:hypothetical protein ACFFQF_03115 [Haladaptatus pallidirubidus]|uniref:Uncharacterized protein n=1 Tax=Haladaptatus pallidirubidus TaxID=1008152 RepID=A0AAV3UAE5_9EURY|nr:hypothetical protein [Haladaptatus pallidirubidus]
MTSLGETYQGRDGVKKRPRRLYLGVGLFLAGSLLVIVGILAATTTTFAGAGVGQYESYKIAGITAGLGIPAVFVGIFTVLPATSKQVRAAVAIGSSISILGVAMFWYAYPAHWRGFGQNLTLPVVAVYFVGLIATFCCLFVAVVNFKTRNDPGGTVTMEVTRTGETKIVEVERQRGFGSVGIFGDPSEENIDAVSDGGATADDISSPMDSGQGTNGATKSTTTTVTAPNTATAANPTDAYCGNCTHFDYVHTDSGMTPYCGLHDRRMADMDACERWQSNR